jgi:hypothetical protein
MFKFARSWVVGGALSAVAVVGCRHTDSSCPTCGHGPVAATPTGTVYHESASGPAISPSYTPVGGASSAVPMPMPSSNGVRVIDGTR